MGAALSIVILFTVSSTIVRVAGVFLEHTGIPRPIARIQAMSALSGTGFTTSESELIVKTPERRRILVMLMILGSISLASAVATIVASAFGVSGTATGVVAQVAAIATAILFVRFVLFAPRTDAWVCGLAQRWLDRHGVTPVDYDLVHRLGNQIVLGEHVIASVPPVDPADWPVGLVPVGLGHTNPVPWANQTLTKGATLILAGPEAAQLAFATAYGAKRDRPAH